jgi:hypothetical protein
LTHLTHLGWMKQFVIILAAVALLFLASFVVPLGLGIWLPDVVFAPIRTLAEEKLESGHSFRVIQYWNHVDFYTTELVHTLPGGRVIQTVLDSDDNKSWSVPMVIDEKGRSVHVTLSGRRLRRISWDGN